MQNLSLENCLLKKSSGDWQHQGMLTSFKFSEVEVKHGSCNMRDMKIYYLMWFDAKKIRLTMCETILGCGRACTCEPVQLMLLKIHLVEHDETVME